MSQHFSKNILLSQQSVSKISCSTHSNFAGHLVTRPAGGSTYLRCSCTCKKQALRSWKIRIINLSHTPLEIKQLWAGMSHYWYFFEVLTAALVNENCSCFVLQRIEICQQQCTSHWFIADWLWLFSIVVQLEFYKCCTYL